MIEVPAQSRESVRSLMEMCHFSGDACRLSTVASLVPTISNPKASSGLPFGLLRTAISDTYSVLPRKYPSIGQYQRSSVPVSKKERGFAVYCFCQKYCMVHSAFGLQVEMPMLFRTM